MLFEVIRYVLLSFKSSFRMECTFCNNKSFPCLYVAEAISLLYLSLNVWFDYYDSNIIAALKLPEIAGNKHMLKTTLFDWLHLIFPSNLSFTFNVIFMIRQGQ